MARKSRKLTEAENRLWSRIAASTTPLPGRPPQAGPENASPAHPAEPAAMPGPPAEDGKIRGKSWHHDMASAPVPRIMPFHIGSANGAAPPVGPQKRMPAAAARPSRVPPPASLADMLGTAPLRMDPKNNRRLRKGKLTPQARIDLHGMTLAEAQPALAGFVLRSHVAGLRLVLVITGKGRGSRDDAGLPLSRPGALRHNVPHWLHMGAMGQMVAQVLPAHDRHGGGGAYYVWLRKPGR